jgi:tetratricopeptide (TPR) repeat protein
LQQTIEMFEVIVQSQPNDCQSLEILKEAYTKLGREQEVVSTSKRIAQAYLQMGQLSSAILEYETVLQRRPNDADVQAALKQIEDKASNVGGAADHRARAIVRWRRPPTRRGSEKRRGRPPRRKLMTAARRCTKFLSRANSSPPAILICAGDRRI